MRDRRRRGELRTGLQAEVVLSLGLVMLAATGLLAASLLRANDTRLRELLGAALVAEARRMPPPELTLVPGTRWWRVPPGGAPLGGAGAPDARTRQLAAAVRRRGEPLVRPGSPWEPIRFATPLGRGGDVAAARLPSAASVRLRAVPLALVAGLLVADVAVFTAFGASLLRRRVVLPLRRLAEASRGVADGAFEAARVPVEGPREAAELAAAFNEMGEALARRTQALEKAVADLRDANAALRNARAGLDRVERLASVGRLAAGVAHEVGNPMGALLAFLDLAGRDPAVAAETRAHLERAAQQGERVRRILRQLLEFSRPQAPARVPVDLAALAEETAAGVRAQRRFHGLSLTVRSEGAAPRALADPGAVAQILLNLALNAADAGGARIDIVVRPSVIGVRPGESRESAAARRAPDAVECLVLDAGHGIADEDRERIFDPFFTSKAPGEGTGLGLSNSLRLAEELGGTLELVSAPEGWRTAFALRLPAEPEGPAGRIATACEVRTGVRGEAADRDPGISRESQS